MDIDRGVGGVLSVSAGACPLDVVLPMKDGALALAGRPALSEAAFDSMNGLPYEDEAESQWSDSPASLRVRRERRNAEGGGLIPALSGVFVSENGSSENLDRWEGG